MPEPTSPTSAPPPAPTATPQAGYAKVLFETLVRENAGSLMLHLRAVTQDAALADDVFQETLCVAWRRLDDFDRQRPFGAWLRGIARRIALDHFSKRTSRPLSPLNPWTDDQLDRIETRVAAIQAAPGDTLEEKAAALRSCVDALPELYAQPVRSFYWEALPISTISAQLAAPSETIKKRLQRARALLAHCLRSAGFFLELQPEAAP